VCHGNLRLLVQPLLDKQDVKFDTGCFSDLPRYFAVFFDEIKDVAPELESVRLAAPRTGDKHLH
jgi:hypothetical protein